MFTHATLWDAVEALAKQRGWSVSNFAIRAGLDATSLNRSKQFGPDGKPRWPSTETLSRLLIAAGVDLVEFARTVMEQKGTRPAEILLVDDDELLRETLATGLRQAGFAVHLAGGHQEALALLQTAGRIDLLCTDLAMPEGLGGVAIARALRDRFPKLPVIYVTGYDFTGIRLDAGTVLLRKPVSIEALQKEISHLLTLSAINTASAGQDDL